MSFFTKNLSKVLLPKNPIQKILDLIPYTDTLVDPKLLDHIGLELTGVGAKILNNSAIMVLLIDLGNAGLLDIKCLEFPSTSGYLFIIKRNT